jgi:hypothetical protein
VTFLTSFSRRLRPPAIADERAPAEPQARPVLAGLSVPLSELVR